MDALRTTYRIEVPAAEAEKRAEALLLEQTVELPRAAVSHPFVLESILPEVNSITPAEAGSSRVCLDYPATALAANPAQLLNVLFGNSSLQPDLVLEEVELPPSLAEVFRGPRFGIEGLRAVVGRPSGALTCTALKPVGLAAEELAGLCHIFALAGVDVIKDDHGLADHEFCGFRDRVRRCLRATADAAASTGRRSLYVPSVVGAPSEVRRQLDFCWDAGVEAVMLMPMLLGMPVFHEMVESLDVPVLAHPALAGALRIEPPALLGTLFRAYGADAVIFPHHGGRFAYGPETCRSLAERLRRPDAACRPALPVPAGGIDVARVADVVAFYGSDVMLLVGGSLYLAGDALLERTRDFVTAVQAAAAGAAARGRSSAAEGPRH